MSLIITKKISDLYLNNNVNACYVGPDLVWPSKSTIPALLFKSDNYFEIGSVDVTWDGTIEYSNDGNQWTTWTGNVINGGSTNTLYIRGTNNTYIIGNMGTGWPIRGTNVSCIGNIEYLLDWQSVQNGIHPTMAAHCFARLFYSNIALITAPELPAITLSPHCYKNMFKGTAITKAPELPATTMFSNCYAGMFGSCTALKTVPELPARTLAEFCYAEMFDQCTSLEQLPKLPATRLSNYCYQYMFDGCTKIKISETQSDEYVNEYRIPITESGTAGTQSLVYMFNRTGGSYTGTPNINTTYYTSNEIV